MRVAILTSSRADYGIYLPLLQAMRNDPYFKMDLIAFGTHTSPFHGNTVTQILKDGFVPIHRVESMLTGDSKEALASSIALTQLKFASIWEQEKDKYDLVFCLGDRYEMFAAVSAGIPFSIPFAHIHGGETTLGAIDDKFRHALTIFSRQHFVATPEYAKKVAALTGTEQNIFYVGALGLDHLETTPLYSKEAFAEQFGIDLGLPTILVTFHPETVDAENNIRATKELILALEAFNYQVIITMPNADTYGASMRNIYLEAAAKNNAFNCVESLGSKGYFTAMKYSKLVVGNSSSGIIEAASLNKYVLDIGKRQEGRITSLNTFNVPAEHTRIRQILPELLQKGEYTGENVYYRGGAAKRIIEHLKQMHV